MMSLGVILSLADRHQHRWLRPSWYISIVSPTKWVWRCDIQASICHYQHVVYIQTSTIVLVLQVSTLAFLILRYPTLTKRSRPLILQKGSFVNREHIDRCVQMHLFCRADQERQTAGQSSTVKHNQCKTDVLNNYGDSMIGCSRTIIWLVRSQYIVLCSYVMCLPNTICTQIWCVGNCCQVCS